MRKVIIIFGLLLINLATFGQFEIDAEIRPKFEFRHGYRQLPMDEAQPGIHINQRTRVTLSYKYQNITSKISFHDIRIWGQENQKDVKPSLGLHEAWFEIPVINNVFIKVGRQEIVYDNQRFFSTNNWLPQGQKHDALLFLYNKEKAALHLGSAFNQSDYHLYGTDYHLNNYKTLNYIWYNQKISSGTRISLLGVADGYEKPNNPNILYMRGTWSAYFGHRGDLISINFNPAYQHGKDKAGLDIRAWYFMAEIGYNYMDNSNIRAGIELFSGDDADIPNDYNNAFDPLYGAGHKNHGHMDYFTNIPVHTKNAGFINPYIKNKTAVSKSLSFNLDLHLFFLQNNYIVNEQIIDKYLGAEIDSGINYKINDLTNIQLGYSMMFGSESMEHIKGGNKNNLAHWAYVMLSFKPKLL